ncbi:MAG: hypothetical protein MUE68_12355 [Bacteroidetes bacterium]|jgi:hypothetical protein|nr:hypothetical protein [Bacteroidota bacterium]
MRSLVFILLLVVSAASAQPAAKERPSEAKPEVQALMDFHDVIAQIWHTAWPNKDTDMLAKVLPEVEQGAEAVVKATLPAILHEREGKWRENVKRLQEVVAEYRAAASPVDKERLLAAAEKLHMQYEVLVRTIRPALKELDDFHGSLYLLYHYALPEKDLQRIHVLAEELKAKMEKLSAATLPARHKEKAAAFEKARTSLSTSVAALHKAVPGGTIATLTPLIEEMHGRYEDLDKVFQ